MADQKKRGSHWFLWWKVDPDELSKAVAEYKTKNPFKSPRGIAACCFVFSAAITVAFYLAGSPLSGGFIDAAIILVLALFVYLGHRWAMLGGMAYWTLSKLMVLYATVQAGSGGIVLGQLIWWCIYMHALWFAFRVEQARRKSPSILATAAAAAESSPGLNWPG